MKTRFFLLFAALAVLAGCKKDPAPQDTPSGDPAVAGEKTFTATIAPLTKVTLGEDAKTLEWNKSDKVSIFDGKGNQLFRAQKGGTSTTLLGEATDAPTTYALFPYDETASLSGSIIQTTLPATQVVNAAGADLKGIAVAKGSGSELAFTTVSSFVKFTLNEDAVGVSSVTISAEGALAGTLSIDCGGNPVVAAGTTSSQIKLTAGEGSFKPGATYYVPVLPGKVKDLTVAYTVGTDELSKVVEGETTLTAASISDAGNLERALTADEKVFLGTWVLLKYGSRGVEGTPGQYPWVNIDRGVPNPDATVGDYITFKSDGSVEMNLGANNDTYNNSIYESCTVSMTGEESWTLLVEDDVKYLQFGGNAFPLFLGDLKGIGGKYRVVEANEAEMILEINYQGDEGEAVLGVYLQPKGKATYAHRFRGGDFGVPESDAVSEVAPLDDNGIIWNVSVEAASPFYFMNPNAGLMLGRAWGGNAAAETAKSALLWTESFTGKIYSVAVKTARFAPEEGEDKSAADLSVYIGGNKVGATYPIVNDMNEYTFTPADPATGKIEVKWETTNEEVNCYFLFSISVIYEE